MNNKSSFSTILWLLAIIFILLLPRSLQLHAHAELTAANPAPGATLSQSPAQIVLTFNETISPGSDIFLFTEGFQYIDDIQVTVSGENDSQLIASLPPLDDDEYNVQWSVIAIDGHVISGTYAFQIQTPSANNIFVWLVAGLIIGFIIIGIIFWRQIGNDEIITNRV